MSYRDIPGTLDFHDAYIGAVRRALDGDILVEIGVGFGQSLAFLAECAIETGKDLQIYGVDTFQNPMPGEDAAAIVNAHGGCFEACAALMKLHAPSAFGYIREIMMSTSVEASRTFTQNRLRPAFVFLDGDARPEAIRQDLAAWYPLLKRGGLIAGRHSLREGMVSLIDDFARSEGRNCHFAGDLWSVEK